MSWALRSIGRRNRVLNEAAVKLAGRLAESEGPGERWLGKEALRELIKVRRQLAARRRGAKA